MRKSKFLKLVVLAIILLFAGASVFPSTGKLILGENSQPDIFYADDNRGANYIKIQDAIDNASIEDTIFVKDIPDEFEFAIMFGRIMNLNVSGENITFEAVNLRIIKTDPCQFLKLTSGELLTIKKDYQGYLGSIIGIQFIIAKCKIVLGNPIAVIETSLGTMRVELFEDKVPITCENFIKLANIGFYESLVFHRVIDDFVIQGGGYYLNGSHKESPYGTIPLEIHPDVRHVDGAIGMARKLDPDSATSQFYICDGAQPYLDDNYAVYGRVIEGMNVLRTIASVETTTKYGMQDWPIDDVIINSIIIKNQ